MGGGLAAWGVRVKRGRGLRGLVWQVEVQPEGVVVRGGGEGGGEGVARRGPEDAGGGDGQVGGGEDVGQAQTAEAIVERGVLGRVAPVGGFVTPMGGAGGGVLQCGVGEQGLQRLRAAVAIQRVEVGLAHEDEGRVRWRDRKRAVQEVEPEGGFIMVAAAVAVFGAVEGGGRGVPEEEGEGRAVDQDGQGDMGVRRQALDGGKARVGVGGDQGSGQVAPEEGGVVLRRAFVQRQAGQDGEAAGTGETAPSLGIGGFVPAAVGIGVEAGRDTGIALRGVEMGVGVAVALQRGGKFGERGAAGVVVDSRQDQHVGIQPADHRADGGDLGVVACPQVLQQEARAIAFEICVPEGDADVPRRDGASGEGQGEGCQAVA